MPTEDAYSSGHLVLSHFGTCMCSNVETNLSWTCLVSGLLNFEHPSVLLFCFVYNQGQLWYPGNETLWTRYRIQFLPNPFQTSFARCWWWEKEPYWFWITGSKVEVNFGTVLMKPCGHDTDYSFCPIIFQTSYVSCWWWEEELYWFGSRGQRSRSTLALYS